MDSRPVECTDVLVVGAGPVGLLLAAELALAGVRPVVLERLTAPSTDRKARGIGPLAVEALRRRGLGPSLDAHHPSGLAEFTTAHSSPNAHFAHIHKIEFPCDRDRVLIWQPQLERVLAEHAARLGVTVLREHALTGLTQSFEAVAATVQTPGGERTFHVRYVVGCDGGRSSVRHLAGFDFPGTPPLSVTRAGEVELADPDTLPPPGPRETGLLMHGGGMLGTTEYGAAAREARDDAPLSIDELSASVERITGQQITITALWNPRRFTDGARQTTTYRKGRILLAGDAAHVHSPNGGQGLDLGLMDAVNLGWKLAATVHTTAPNDLLDTYTRERHPFGAAVLHNTNAQAALLTPGPHFEALRQIMSELLDLHEVKNYFIELMSRLHHRYALPYAGDDLDPLRDLLGLHVCDVAVTTENTTTTLYTLATTGRPLLICSEDVTGIGDTAAAWASQIDLIPLIAPVIPVIPGGPALPGDCSGMLIRPDGVIAWAAPAGRRADLDLLATALHTWIGAGASVAQTAGTGSERRQAPDRNS